MKARILEAWDMELPEPIEGEQWFLDWVLRAPKQAGIHLTAGWWALESIKELEIETVCEYFGGMGAQALMVEELWEPMIHTVLEYNQHGVEHLSSVLGDKVLVHQADSYEPMQTRQADLQVLDFGDLTIHKMATPGPHRSLLERVFANKPKAVVITDVACRYLHLHRERYDAIFGTPGASSSYESYLRALAGYVELEWGYGLVAGFSHRWSTVMAFTPVHETYSTRGIVPTPESPAGLVLS